ncbi:unnamed protein product, partial [Closterium sp. NIES-54]
MNQDSSYVACIGRRSILLFVAAVSAGIAAGATAAVTATVFPYSLGLLIGMLRTNDGKKDAKTTKTKEKTTKKAGTSISSIISGGGNITASGGYGVGPLTKEGQLHRDVVMSAVIESSALQVSFDSFPYYLSDATRNALVDACFIRLRRPEFLRFIADLPSLSTRILLSGPPGSERYQEQLVRALARHLDAKLLIFDLPNMLLQVWLVQ